jgi:hypothetical protein
MPYKYDPSDQEGLFFYADITARLWKRVLITSRESSARLFDTLDAEAGYDMIW